MNVNDELLHAELRPSSWWTEQPAEVTELPDHIALRLVRAGYHTAQQIRDAGPDKLRTIKGIGPVAVTEISIWLRRLDGEDE